MRGTLALYDVGHLIAKFTHIDTLPEILARAQQHRAHSKMHLVYQPCL